MSNSIHNPISVDEKTGFLTSLTTHNGDTEFKFWPRRLRVTSFCFISLRKKSPGCLEAGILLLNLHLKIIQFLHFTFVFLFDWSLRPQRISLRVSRGKKGTNSQGSSLRFISFTRLQKFRAFIVGTKEGFYFIFWQWELRGSYGQQRAARPHRESGCDSICWFNKL